MLSKLILHFINNSPGATKVEKCWLRHTMSENLFYAFRKRKRTSSNLNGRAPSLSMKSLPEEPIAFEMLRIIALSRTHGELPGSEDSTHSSAFLGFTSTRFLSFFFSMYVRIN